MRLTLAFYYLVKKKTITRKKNRTLLKIKEKKINLKMNVLIYLMVYYANIFQPILMKQTEYSLGYEMKKNKCLSYACALISSCDAVVSRIRNRNALP